MVPLGFNHDPATCQNTCCKTAMEAAASVSARPLVAGPMWSKEVFLTQTLEWLYLNDNNFKDKLEWRKAFIEELKKNLYL